MTNFLQRTFTAFFFVVFVIGSILLGRYTFSGLFLVFTVLGLIEFYRIVEKDSIKPLRAWGVFTGGCVYLLISLLPFMNLDVRYLYFLLLPFVLTLVIELFRNKESPLSNIAYTLFGVFYIAIPFALLSYFMHPFNPGSKDPPGILLGFFIILWINDTGAYLVGMILGKHKLFERISPKKTWEGLLGGIVFGLLTAWVLSLIFLELTQLQWFIFALLIVVFGTLGDLVESMFKRSLIIKDSGSVFPGHGGILDRFDGVLLAVPVVLIYLMLI